MRVIAGTARSLPLKTLPGLETRPTTDRTKETLFNMLQPAIADCRFLDLFAGSGAIGIEALSRGADFCVFIEKNRKAVECIGDNLAFTKLQDRARVMHTDAISGLSQLLREEPFDCIFMDPPYDMGLEKQVLEICSRASFVGENTLFIIEASLDTEFGYLEEIGYDLVKQKRYKTNTHLILKRHKEIK